MQVAFKTKYAQINAVIKAKKIIEMVFVVKSLLFNQSVCGLLFMIL